MCSLVKPAAAGFTRQQTPIWTFECFVKVLTNSALVVHRIVVVLVVGPARLADGLVGHFLSVLALFPLLQLSGFGGFGFASFRFDGFGLALGHGALLTGAFVGRLAALLAIHGALIFLLSLLSLLTIRGALIFLLAEALLARVLLVLALVLSVAVLALLAVLVFGLLLLIITLVLLAVLIFALLLLLVTWAALLAVLLLLTVLRHSFGKLRLDDQVAS